MKWLPIYGVLITCYLLSFTPLQATATVEDTLATGTWNNIQASKTLMATDASTTGSPLSRPTDSMVRMSPGAHVLNVETNDGTDQVPITFVLWGIGALTIIPVCAALGWARIWTATRPTS